MVKIRLKRTGKKNAPCYRVVVADSRSPRDGKNIETIGFYDPINAQERLDVDRADYWVSNGAQPSSTVADIIRRAKTGEATSGKKTQIREDAVKAKAAEEAKAKAEAEAAAKAEAAEAAKAEKAAAAETATEEAPETSEG
jgi:small subunit ribosomal protein S16